MGRTIPTCSLIALALAATAAEARRGEPTALGHYMRARAADNRNAFDVAASSYAAALTAEPANPTIAFRAYREGVEAGNFALALRAAQALERDGLTPPDATILFYIAALRERDWAAAKVRLAGVANERSFSFLAPVLGAWLALATKDGDPVAILDAGAKKAPSAYAGDARALLLIATGRRGEGLAAVRALHSTDLDRAAPLRIAAASMIADAGDRETARTLLNADDALMRAAQLRLTGKAALGASVIDPAGGAGWLLAAMATDLMRERPSRAPLTLARFAQLAAPRDLSKRLVVARALGRLGHGPQALALIEPLRADPLYGGEVASLRIDLLAATGRAEEALAEAAALAQRSADAKRGLGDLQVRFGKAAEAGRTYREIIASVGEDAAEWQLWVAAGGAFETAGDWAAAKPLLERALVIAPDEPDVLNHLGYALLVRGEDVDRATRLIAKASAMRPDDAAIVDSLGWARMKRGEYDAAIPLLERAVALDNTQPEIGEHLGDAYWFAGRRVEARYAWAAARAQADPGSVVRLDAKIANGTARP